MKRNCCCIGATGFLAVITFCVAVRPAYASTFVADTDGPPTDSDGAPPPRRIANLVAIAKIGKSKQTANGPLVALEIERVLKGNRPDGKLLIKDELPRFGCYSGRPQWKQKRRVSKIYRPGTQVVLYLQGGGENWELYEIHEFYPRYLQLYEAARSAQFRKNLKPLINVENGGLDRDALFLLKTFAPEKERTALLLDMLQELSDRLKREELQKSRDKILQVHLHPLVTVLAALADGKPDAEALSPLLACLPYVKGDGYQLLRGHIFSGLAELAKSPNAKPQDVSRVRQVLLSSVRGCLDPKQMRKYNSVYLTQHDAAVAVHELASFVNAEVVEMLLEEFARRPFTASHPDVVVPLSIALEFKSVNRRDKNRIKETWLKTLVDIKAPGERFSPEGNTVVSIVGALHVATTNKYLSLTAQEQKQLLALYQKQPPGWYRDSLKRLFAKPPKVKKGGQ